MTTTTAKPEASVDKQRQPEGTRGWKETAGGLDWPGGHLRGHLVADQHPAARVHWAEWMDETFGLVNLPPDPSLFTVVLLFVLGNALRRRIRFAMWVRVRLPGDRGAHPVAIVAALLFSESVDVDIPGAASRDVRVGLLLFEGVVGLALCVLFSKARTAFPARLVRGSRIRALAVLIGGLALSAIVATALTAGLSARPVSRVATDRLAASGRDRPAAE